MRNSTFTMVSADDWDGHCSPGTTSFFTSIQQKGQRGFAQVRGFSKSRRVNPMVSHPGSPSSDLPAHTTSELQFTDTSTVPTLHERCQDDDVNAATATIYFNDNTTSSGTVPDDNNLSLFGMELNEEQLSDNVSHNKDEENNETANQYITDCIDNPTATYELQQKEIGIEYVNDYEYNVEVVKEVLRSMPTQENMSSPFTYDERFFIISGI